MMNRIIGRYIYSAAVNCVWAEINVLDTHTYIEYELKITCDEMRSKYTFLALNTAAVSRLIKIAPSITPASGSSGSVIFITWVIPQVIIDDIRVEYGAVRKIYPDETPDTAILRENSNLAASKPAASKPAETNPTSESETKLESELEPETKLESEIPPLSARGTRWFVDAVGAYFTDYIFPYVAGDNTMMAPRFITDPGHHTRITIAAHPDVLYGIHVINHNLECSYGISMWINIIYVLAFTKNTILDRLEEIISIITFGDIECLRQQCRAVIVHIEVGRLRGPTAAYNPHVLVCLKTIMDRI